MKKILVVLAVAGLMWGLNAQVCFARWGQKEAAPKAAAVQKQVEVQEQAVAQTQTEVTEQAQAEINMAPEVEEMLSDFEIQRQQLEAEVYQLQERLGNSSLNPEEEAEIMREIENRRMMLDNIMLQEEAETRQ